MLQLNYYVHCVLNSKYFLAYKLFILFFVYVIFYSDKLIYCMNENNNVHEVPFVAEAKNTIKPSEQVIALRRNIQAYAGNIASLLEEKNQVINEHQKQLVNQKNLINRQFWRIQENTDTITYLEDELDKQTLALNQLELELIHLRNLPPQKTCCCIS